MSLVYGEVGFGDNGTGELSEPHAQIAVLYVMLRVISGTTGQMLTSDTIVCENISRSSGDHGRHHPAQAVYAWKTITQ